jgi:hypothetical protein
MLELLDKIQKSTSVRMFVTLNLKRLQQYTLPQI